MIDYSAATIIGVKVTVNFDEDGEASILGKSLEDDLMEQVIATEFGLEAIQQSMEQEDVFIGELISNTEDSEVKPIPSDNEIKALKTKLKKLLTVHDLWDEKDFGIHTILCEY